MEANLTQDREAPGRSPPLMLVQTAGRMVAWGRGERGAERRPPRSHAQAVSGAGGAQIPSPWGPWLERGSEVSSSPAPRRAGKCPLWLACWATSAGYVTPGGPRLLFPSPQQVVSTAWPAGLPLRVASTWLPPLQLITGQRVGQMTPETEVLEPLSQRPVHSDPRGQAILLKSYGQVPMHSAHLI